MKRKKRRGVVQPGLPTTRPPITSVTRWTAWRGRRAEPPSVEAEEGGFCIVAEPSSVEGGGDAREGHGCHPLIWPHFEGGAP